MTESDTPFLQLVAATRNTITLRWGPAALLLLGHTFSQDSTSGHQSPHSTATAAAPANMLSVGEDRPDYRLQIKCRGSPWQTTYWGYKTRLELDNMAPGDSFHFRVQRGQDDQTPMVTLHRAISQGLPHRARKFLSQRPLAVDVPDRAGRTALLLAVLRGDLELVYLLLNAGADPNSVAEGAANRTPLMLAAHQGAPLLCRALRDRGARWDIPDRNGCTALHYAVAGSGAVRRLGAAAAPVPGGSEDVVRMALEDGADLRARDSRGWTPLMRAVLLGGSMRVVSLLLESGGAGGQRPEEVDVEGHTALHLAALVGRQDVAALLSRHGADLKAKSPHGRSARELGRCWPITLAEGANKGGVDATLAVATAASTMLKKRAARRKQEELDEQV